MKNKLWAIYYKSNEGDNMVGSAVGETVDEAVAHFSFWHEGEDFEITSVEVYK